MEQIDRSAAMRTAAAACCGAAVIIMLVGCNRGSQESQVSGSVTLDGSRIGPGMVVFAPVEGGKPATGSIESNGSFTLNTSREPGLAAGKYKVAVSIRELPENVKRSDQIPPGKLLIPEKYEQSTTSGLEYEVEPGQNSIDIDLTTS
ncbi:MAG TPA: hypothetical protein VGA66_03325 [Mycobacterium sp.]